MRSRHRLQVDPEVTGVAVWMAAIATGFALLGTIVHDDMNDEPRDGIASSTPDDDPAAVDTA